MFHYKDQNTVKIHSITFTKFAKRITRATDFDLCDITGGYLLNRALVLAIKVLTSDKYIAKIFDIIF